MKSEEHPMNPTLKRLSIVSWNRKMHQWRNRGADRVFVDLEDAFLDRGRLHKILVRPLKMRPEVGAGFLFVWLETRRTKIVSHTPKYVHSRHIQHRRVIG